MWRQTYFMAILFFVTPHLAHGANILFFLGIGSHSHRRILQALADPLFDKGHNITFLSPIPPDTPNPQIKEFYPSALQTLFKTVVSSQSTVSMLGRIRDENLNDLLVNYGVVMWDSAFVVCDAIVNSPDTPDWIENSPKYDLIIIDHPLKECAFAFVHKFKAKSILFSPMAPLDMDFDLFGWPSEASWLPTWSDGVGPFLSNSLWRQFMAPIDTVLWYFSYQYRFLRQIEDSYKKSEAFGSIEDMPPLVDLVRATDLYLINTHFSADYARPWAPFVVPVGGIHVEEKPSTNLPQPIKQFIEMEDDNIGFVFVSFGSVIKISELPPEQYEAFVDSFRHFKNVKFLLKWEGDNPPKGLPANVLTMKWFPQASILTHPKCRGFITQGGVVSNQQAFAYGVPIITIPTWGDQSYNAQLAVHHGNGIHLELARLTQNGLLNSLNELLNNPKYAQRAKELAVHFMDRPMSPVDTAVYWTEYVLRHDDLSHLKPLSIHQTWWQRRLLHVYAAYFIIILALLWALKSVTKFVVNRLLVSSRSSGSEKKVKKS